MRFKPLIVALVIGFGLAMPTHMAFAQERAQPAAAEKAADDNQANDKKAGEGAAGRSGLSITTATRVPRDNQPAGGDPGAENQAGERKKGKGGSDSSHLSIVQAPEKQTSAGSPEGTASVPIIVPPGQHDNSGNPKPGNSKSDMAKIKSNNDGGTDYKCTYGSDIVPKCSCDGVGDCIALKKSGKCSGEISVEEQGIGTCQAKP
ncbi:MAG: hypothetical protein ACPG06_10675 [Alphaproteobacteria bacterium]